MWEGHVPEPLLDVRLFRNRRFSAASLAVTLGFFSLFGFIFLVTQYFQLVKGYSALQAGVRTVPFAVAMAIGAITAPQFVKRAGTKLVVAAGLTLMATGFAVAATTDAASSYGIIVVAMVFMGSGWVSHSHRRPSRSSARSRVIRRASARR